MRRLILVLSLTLGLSFLAYPPAFLSGKTTLPDDNDTRLIAYIIGQVQNNLLHHQPLYWGAYFSPYENTLAYSDLFLTSALLTLPFRLVTSSPVQIFNFALIIDFFLTLTTSFLLFRYLFADDWLAIFLTILLNLSGYHLAYLPHLQVFSLWPVLLSFYFFLRFFHEAGSFFLLLFFLTVTAQVLESIFPVYLIFFSIIILIISDRKNPNTNHRLRSIIHHLIFFLPLWFIFLFPYLKLHFAFPEAARSIRDAAHFSLGLEEIFTKYHSWTLTLLLILFSLKPLPRIQSRFWTILLFSLVMSFGPVVKLFGRTFKIFGLPIPLPYAAFYYLFPGFTGFRTPSRFIILAVIAATIVISYKLQPIFKSLLPQTKFFLTCSLLLLLMLEFHLPLPSYPVDMAAPPVYRQVQKLPATAVILELPIKLWNDDDHEIESIRSLYSLEHGHRRVGGFSGFAPFAWIDLVENLKANGPNDENRNRLHALGVTHIVEGGRLYSLP